jgi:hypothetical protein
MTNIPIEPALRDRAVKRLKKSRRPSQVALNLKSH